jgi:hypothetical protein
MFKRRTLFVVGAGASAEYGLPPGKLLASKISKKMDIRFEPGNRQIGQGDMDIYAQLTNGMQRHVDEFQRAAWLIRDGIHLARSIDDFLDLHQSNSFVVEYGKAAIVKSVLEAERESNLYFGGCSGRDSFHPGGLANTWLVKFMQMLGPGIRVENVREIFDKVSFVIFNYDRCIEFFLGHALQKLYGLSERDATAVLDDLDVFHPYGVIDHSIPFGAPTGNYVKLATGIKTYTEQIDDADLRTALSNKVPDAEHIVFLGFAYHDQNMELLTPQKEIPFSRRIFGTAHGMSDSDVEVVGHQIDAWFAGRKAQAYRSTMIRLENKLKCADLFDYYAKSLTGP